MLSVTQAIEQRRSIRHFRSDPVPREMILQMLEAARLAPSGGNRQPWRFAVVTDIEERKLLRQLCVNSSFVEEAPLVFVAAFDLSVYSREASRRSYQELADAIGSSQRRVESPPELDRQTKISLATGNTYIAIEHIVLMAAALGLGSCWVRNVGDPEGVKAMLGITGDDIMVLAVVPVGYPQAVPPPRPRISMDEILLRPLPEPAKD